MEGSRSQPCALLAVLLVSLSILGAGPHSADAWTAVPSFMPLNAAPTTAPAVQAGAAPPLPAPATTIAIQSNLSDLAINPAQPQAYVADRANAQVIVIETDLRTIITNLSLPAPPTALAMNPSGTTLYVGYGTSRTITTINVAKLRVSGTWTVPFLASSIAAPTDDTLVATTHDDAWSGQHPYVLSTVNGSVLQRLTDGQGNLVYQDALPVLSPDGTRLFIVDTRLAPAGILSFTRGSGTSTWTFAGKGALQEGEAYAKDAAVSPDNQYLYLVTNRTPLLKIGSQNFSVVARLGPSENSTSVALAATGCALALAHTTRVFSGNLGRNVSITELLYDTPSGRDLASQSFSGVASKFRATADGLNLVALVGESAQDIEVLSSTRAGTYGPRGYYINDTTPRIFEVVATFAPASALAFNLSLDGVPIPGAAFDPVSGELAGQITTPLVPDVEHSVYMSATWPKGGFGGSRSLFVHLAPPVLQVMLLPARLTDPEVTVRGNVTDEIPFTLRINEQEVPRQTIGFDDSFAAEVPLVQGNNTITVVAEDYAGNRVSSSQSILFDPWLDWFTSLSRHFRIPIPYLWQSWGSIAPGGTPVDLYMDRPDVQANLVVYSEARALSGTHEEARAILREDTDSLGHEADFAFLSPVEDRTIDGHAAASAFVTWHPANDLPVDQLVTVVVGPEHGMFWAIIGTVYVSNATRVVPILNLTTEAFQVLLPGTGPTPPPDLGPWLWYGALLATAVEACGLGLLILRTSRRGNLRGISRESER